MNGDLQHLAPIVAVVVVMAEIIRGAVAAIAPSRERTYLEIIAREIRDMNASMSGAIQDIRQGQSEIGGMVRSLHKMHSHTDQNGRPSWYVPSSMTKSIEKISGDIADIKRSVADGGKE